MILLVLLVLTALPASANNCVAFSKGFTGFESGNLCGWDVFGAPSIVPTYTPFSNAAPPYNYSIAPPTGKYQALLTSSGTLVDSVDRGLGNLDIREFGCWVPPCAPSWHILSSYSTQYNPLLPGYGSSGEVFSLSAIKTPVTVSEGDILSFKWNFLSGESNDPDYVDYGYYNDAAFFAIGSDGYELASTLSPYLIYQYPAISGYRTLTHRFTQSGTFDLLFGIGNVSDERSPSYLLLDNISLTRPVPEPSEWILLTTVGIVLAYLVARRRLTT